MSQSAPVPRSRETSLVLCAGAVLAVGLGAVLHGGPPLREAAPAATVPVPRQAGKPAAPLPVALPLALAPPAPATVAAAIPASMTSASSDTPAPALQAEPATGSLPPAMVQPDPDGATLQPSPAATQPLVRRVSTASVTAETAKPEKAAEKVADAPGEGPGWLTLAVPHDVPTLDGATFIVDTSTYRLAGVEPVPADEICATKTGAPWACGSRARVALRLAIVDQTLRCRPQATSAADVTTVTCLKDGKPLAVARAEP